MLIKYVRQCFQVASKKTSLRSCRDIFNEVCSADGSKNLNSDALDGVMKSVDETLHKMPTGESLSALLHFQAVCEALFALRAGGELLALKELNRLEEDADYGFAWAQRNGLPCSSLQALLQHHGHADITQEETPGTHSGLGELVQQLLHVDWDRRNTEGIRPIALVLVKRRKTALSLTNFLSGCSFLKQHRVNTTFIIGHGSSNPGGAGMTISKQKQQISKVRQGLYQVVVATSIAEEGLDLPVCELVVQMDPPNTVTALVQVRGRARKRGARFVALCRENDMKLQELLQREQNMEEAVRLILGYHRWQSEQ